MDEPLRDRQAIDRHHRARLRVSGSQSGPLEIDAAGREARREGELLSLTAKEFDLLWFLASNPNGAFSRDQLMHRVWGYSSALTPAPSPFTCDGCARSSRMSPRDRSCSRPSGGSVTAARARIVCAFWCLLRTKRSRSAWKLRPRIRLARDLLSILIALLDDHVGRVPLDHALDLQLLVRWDDRKAGRFSANRLVLG
jgi:hypothetical protein